MLEAREAIVDLKDPYVESVSLPEFSSGSCKVERNVLAAVPEHQVPYYLAKLGVRNARLVVSTMYMLIDGLLNDTESQFRAMI